MELPSNNKLSYKQPNRKRNASNNFNIVDPENDHEIRSDSFDSLYIRNRRSIFDAEKLTPENT